MPFNCAKGGAGGGGWDIKIANRTYRYKIDLTF